MTCDWRDCPAPGTEIRPPIKKYGCRPLCYCKRHAAMYDKDNEARPGRDQPTDTGSHVPLLRASIQHYQLTGKLP
jgi:hypothetical protein